MSIQRLADTVHRSVLVELSSRHAEISQDEPPLIHGFKRNARVMADIWVETEVRKLQAAKHHKAYDETRIRDHAENYATLCSRMHSLDARRNFGASVGIEPPISPAKEEHERAAGERERWDDPMWWRRQLRKVWTRQSEDALREIGLIRRGKQPYASDAAVEHRAARTARTREWLQSRQMVSESGEALELEQLHKTSMANPTIRRQEFMCRVRGFEEFADSAGHVALFWTLTTPSRFHAQLHHGRENPNWSAERARVRDAQGWLCATWARARAKLHRMGVVFYGVRVAEPHHDGTPHWHALIWVPPHQAETVRREIRALWLTDDGDAPGAQDRRTTCIDIDRSKGSAVGYIAKYIAKNVDGAGAAGDAISDETGEKVGAYDNPKSDVHRVAAWASVHGIRQFQQMGGPPVGLWRELRRLRDPVASALLESIRAPADGGKWCDFIGSLGGIERARRRVGSVRSRYSRSLRIPKVRALRLATTQWRRKCGPRVVWHMRFARPDELPAAWLDRAEPRATDPQGRDVLAATRYGEMPEPRAAGVCSYGLLGRYQVADTRLHRWRIEKKCSSPLDTASPPGSLPDGRARDGSGDSSWKGQEIRQPMMTIALFDSVPALDSRSDLGPVAITVRKTASSEGEAPELSMTVPYRERQELQPFGAFVGPPRPLAWLGTLVGPPDPRERRGHIRSDDEFRRLAWSLVNTGARRH